MNEPADYVFVTIVPNGHFDQDFIRETILAQGLPADEQTQFAGKDAFETAVHFTKQAIGRLAEMARKLLDADKIEEITIEYHGSKVVLRGVPADRAKTADELTEHILQRLRS